MYNQLVEQGFLVIDNLLPSEEHDNIYKVLSNPNFPWYLQPKTIRPNESGDADGDMKYLCHCYYSDGKPNSQYFINALALLSEFSSRTGIHFNEIIRCQSNLTFPHPSQMVTPQHVDQFVDHYVIIYYVNDSDGDTILFKDGEIYSRVNPKAGRFLIFDGSLLHSGETPVNTDVRIIFNYNVRK